MRLDKAGEQSVCGVSTLFLGRCAIRENGARKWEEHILGYYSLQDLKFGKAMHANRSVYISVKYTEI